ncbi:hypothetical protein EDD76_12214 [Kineothrix alysoides]|uniref:Resolvase/invertase-type recombinase catalytic domain-containing protein n=1 Tax=Kineothrix alysoides TaxID=1469948 RepID=A0A4R1QKC9_9FIRM|nr:recombinase family protein [Kineothrix alysoides]TCL54098.1 hypothetical protein EDD76_12214 [Kineothrix alysoides]
MITSQNYVAGTSAKTLNPAGPQIIVIDPVVQVRSHKQRTAAYARVSSDSDDQQNSFAAQVSYYTALIGGTEEWELVDIYADEGITGLRMDKEKWYCESDGCDFSPRITDALLIGQATDLLNLAIQNPTSIEIPPIEIRPHDLEATRLTNEINRELDKTDCDEEYAKILIMARAAAQYGICPDGLLPKKARELRKAFESRKPSAEFDTELFKHAVDAVIVQPDGTVSLKLKNGQHLNGPERSTPPC